MKTRKRRKFIVCICNTRREAGTPCLVCCRKDKEVAGYAPSGTGSRRVNHPVL